MKHFLLSLNEIRQTSLRCFRYSTLRTSLPIIIFLSLAISCAPLPPSDVNVPETSTTAPEQTTNTQPTLTEAKLPESATIDFDEIPYFRNVFKRAPAVRGRLALANFHQKMREMGQRSALVSNCSFDILKAFVAKGWAPIVLVQMESGSAFISPISHYDNASGQVHLQNPNSQSKRRLTFDEFEKSWEKDSQKRCVIITPKRLNKEGVQKTLGEYLPTKAFEQIKVNSH